MKKIIIFSLTFITLLCFTIYAYISCNYLLFEVNFFDGYDLYTTVTVNKNKRIEYPSEPDKANYIFTGWYIDNEEFDFDTKIEGDLDLYAKWVDRYAFEDVVVDNYTFRCYNSSTATLLSYDGKDNEELTHIVIPTTVINDDKEFIVTRIEEEAFLGCIYLCDVTLPEGLTELGRGAFSSCIRLTSIDLPDGITTIYDNTFYKCTALVNVILPSNLKTIEFQAFSTCYSIVNIFIPTTVEYIGYEAFYSCAALTHISLPSGIKVIEDKTFAYNFALKTVYLPSNLEEIGAFVFHSCWEIKSIAIPDSVHTIGMRAFVNCKSLDNVSLPTSLETLGSNIFLECYAITTILLPEDNKNFKFIDSNLYSMDETILYEYFQNENYFVLPKSVTTIYEGAFLYSNLIGITLHDDLKVIGAQAFSFCENLKYVVIPNSVVYIGDFCFSTSTSLQYVNIPESVDYVGFAFAINTTSATIYTSLSQAKSSWDISWNCGFPNVVWDYDVNNDERFN